MATKMNTKIYGIVSYIQHFIHLVSRGNMNLILGIPRNSYRSSCSEELRKKVVLENYAKFLIYRVPGLQLQLKRDSNTDVFLIILRSF